MLIVFVFTLAFFLSIVADLKCVSVRKQLLIFLCIILTFIVGLREYIGSWPDTGAYIYYFEFYTSDLFDFKFNSVCYKEEGFYFLSSIIKTITSDSTLYLTIISALTFYYLYKVLQKYSIFPLIGLCVYVARFIFGRNFMQIRAALAIVVFLIGLEYITNKDAKKYTLLSTVSFFLHYSIIMAIPMYLLTKINITKKHIVWGLLAAYGAAFFLSGPIRTIVSNFSFTYEIAMSYTSEASRMSYGQGLLNPMIYYQTALLLVFTFFEEKLQNNKHYYTFRNGYFYSTLILILLSSFSVLSGRGSTIFATLEIIIVPLLISYVPKKWQLFSAICVGIMYTMIFYMYYSKLEFL